MLTVATASFVILFPGSPQEKLRDAAREYQRRNATTQEESKENTLIRQSRLINNCRRTSSKWWILRRL